MRAKAQKFRELILYVARRCETDPEFSAAKLSKILFYSDFRAYEGLGASITGEVYQKLENGPVPKRLVAVLRDLEEERACVWADRYYHGKNLKKLIALQEPDLSVFKPEEIDLVRDVIEDLWELNATQVSVLSRRFVGWQAADLKEEIPYGTVFVDDPRQLSEEEHEWALGAISRANQGWKLARDKETIPYEAVFLSDRPLTEEEIEYGRRLATEFGL